MMMGGYGMMGRYGYGMMGGLGFGLIGWVIQLLVIVLVIYFVYHLFKKNSIKEKHGTRNEIDILKERFARGEIDEEELKRKRDILKRL